MQSQKRLLAITLVPKHPNLVLWFRWISSSKCGTPSSLKMSKHYQPISSGTSSVASLSRWHYTVISSLRFMLWFLVGSRFFIWLFPINLDACNCRRHSCFNRVGAKVLNCWDAPLHTKRPDGRLIGSYIDWRWLMLTLTMPTLLWRKVSNSMIY